MNNLKSIYAGIAIGLGGYVFLSVDDKVLGSFLFSIGLIAVLIFSLNLYTGKACNLDYLRKPWLLIKIWLLNLVGTSAVALCTIGHDDLINKARNMVEAKLTKPLHVVFIDAVICGICIAIAVKGYAKSKNFLIVVLGVVVFILVGAEHIVADMFYFGVGAGVGIKELMFLIIVTLGNTFGGFLLSIIDR